jgi:hypothetical protein
MTVKATNQDLLIEVTCDETHSQFHLSIAIERGLYIQ